MKFLRRIRIARQRTDSSKIFGIGLGKTGTTSLHFALELLGFRSAHASTFFSQVINQEARNRQPLLSTIENKYDAFIDWPISHLVHQLDRRFPRSRFILTLRSAESRYRSCLRHIKEDRERREKGLSYAWTELPSKDQFKAEDEQHTRKMLAYFKHRPNDLLVMQLDHGYGWAELCRFLGVSSPDIPFPHHKAHGSHESHFLRHSPVEPHPMRFDLRQWI